MSSDVRLEPWEYAELVVHRVLAHHEPREVCPECPLVTFRLLEGPGSAGES